MWNEHPRDWIKLSFTGATKGNPPRISMKEKVSLEMTIYQMFSDHLGLHKYNKADAITILKGMRLAENMDSANIRSKGHSILIM